MIYRTVRTGGFFLDFRLIGSSRVWSVLGHRHKGPQAHCTRRSAPQKRHLMAAALMVSAQKGHGRSLLL